MGKPWTALCRPRRYYRKRVQYQTYDVTNLLRQGGNTLTVQLADGWYRGSVGAHGLCNQYGTEAKLVRPHH